MTSETTRSTLPKALGPYAPARRAHGFVYLSGQTGKRPGTTDVVGTVAEQTMACISNLAAVLEQYGLDLSDVVKCNVYLTSMATFAEMNQAFGRSFGSHTPARTTVGVRELPLAADVEIECIAAEQIAV